MRAQAQGVVNRREPAELRARAQALGIPTVDYDNSLSMAVREMDGGRGRFLQFVQLAAEEGDDDALKFHTVFHEVKVADRHTVSLDLVCIAAGVSRVELLKTIVGVAFEHYTQVGNLVAAAAHPNLVGLTVKSAKRLKSQIGQKDRHALLAHAGFLPTAKGTVVNVLANASASAAASSTGSDAQSVPRFLDDVEAAAVPRDTIQRQLLTDGVVLADDVAVSPADSEDEDEIGWPQ